MNLETLEKMLAQGRDSAMLRFTLGKLYLEREEIDPAIEHLVAAVEQDESYSVAWKLYGRALTEAGDNDGARAAFDRGIEAAEAGGDIQAAKEMRVFRRRLDR